MTGVLWIAWTTALGGFVYHPHYVGLILGALIGITVVLGATIWDDWQDSRLISSRRRRRW